jgi:UPF0755 protein
MNIDFLKKKNISRISPKFFRKTTSMVGIIISLLFLFVCFEIYVPINPNSHETIIYTAEKGMGDDEIAVELQKLKIIRNNYFFRFYVIATLRHSTLQAGEYNLSSKMSIAQIAQKMEKGDVIKDEVVILEGWDIKDIGKYLESKNICTQDYFIYLTQKDYSSEFDFLDPLIGGKPKEVDVEGYLFPDTYQIAKGESCEDILNVMLSNFDRKLTSALRAEIKNQKKSIFDVVIMASLIEKEVRTLDDRKTVSGILWKRLGIGMPLQLDATINYITGKSDPSATIKDTKIDSPYNTYKYKGLPKGPISNPGMDSIKAAIYPKLTNYWYYLSNGRTFFSETLDQHNAAAVMHLGR